MCGMSARAQSMCRVTIEAVWKSSSFHSQAPSTAWQHQMVLIDSCVPTSMRASYHGTGGGLR
eukprot:6096232-Amphidinium_carterae.2